MPEVPSSLPRPTLKTQPNEEAAIPTKTNDIPRPTLKNKEGTTLRQIRTGNNLTFEMGSCVGEEILTALQNFDPATGNITDLIDALSAETKKLGIQIGAISNKLKKIEYKENKQERENLIKVSRYLGSLKFLFSVFLANPDLLQGLQATDLTNSDNGIQLITKTQNYAAYLGYAQNLDQVDDHSPIRDFRRFLLDVGLGRTKSWDEDHKKMHENLQIDLDFIILGKFLDLEESLEYSSETLECDADNNVMQALLQFENLVKILNSDRKWLKDHLMKAISVFTKYLEDHNTETRKDLNCLAIINEFKRANILGIKITDKVPDIHRLEIFLMEQCLEEKNMKILLTQKDYHKRRHTLWATVGRKLVGDKDGYRELKQHPNAQKFIEKTRSKNPQEQASKARLVNLKNQTNNE